MIEDVGVLDEAYLQSSKVNDRVNLWVFRKDVVECLLVCNVHLVEVRALPGDELDAVDDLF